MHLGIRFYNCGSIHFPFPGLLVFLVVYVELVHEGLGITLVLYVQKDSLEVLSEVQIIVDVSLVWWFSTSATT